MPNIRQALLIGASVERVYEAIASQEGLSAWWAEEQNERIERDSILRFAFGPDYSKEMRVTELEPRRMVRWVCTAGVDEWVGTNISFELDGGDAGRLLEEHPEAEDQIKQQQGPGEHTFLTFSHDGWREYSPMFAECSYTWGRFLKSLKLLCETGEGRPYPTQHQAVDQTASRPWPGSA